MLIQGLEPPSSEPVRWLADYPLNYVVHPKGFEPPSSEPESEILSIELWMHMPRI